LTASTELMSGFGVPGASSFTTDLNPPPAKNWTSAACAARLCASRNANASFAVAASAPIFIADSLKSVRDHSHAGGSSQ
jgi:hypothetical protein